MTDKITLTQLANLQNENTAVNAINTNSNIITQAVDNTLSRDGTSPNQMLANIDMNSNRILNLPAPISVNEPVRAQDLASFVSGTLVVSQPINDALITAFGTTPDLFITSNGSNYITRALVGTDLPNPSTTTKGGIFSLPVTSNSVLSGIDNTGTPTRATTTGTGNVVRDTSPTIATSLAVSGTETITSNNVKALAVGRLGSTTPAFQVDASSANSVTGVMVSSQSTGNGANITAIGDVNTPLNINASGSGTINLGAGSTGSISLFRNTFINHDTNPTIQLGSVGGSLAEIATPGTSGLAFATNTSTNQVQINHTASANRTVTLTGSNGGNPTIGTSAGNLAVSSPLTLSTALATGSGGTGLNASTDTSATFINRALSVQNTGDTNDSSAGSGSYRAYNLSYTVPANFWLSGRALRISAHFRVTTGTVAPSSLDIQLKIGGTVVAHYSPGAPGTSLTNTQFGLQWLSQATAAPGASVNTETVMFGNSNAVGASTVSSDTAQPVALATNGTLAITIESKWGSAGTGTWQLKLSQFIVEAIN